MENVVKFKKSGFLNFHEFHEFIHYKTAYNLSTKIKEKFNHESHARSSKLRFQTMVKPRIRASQTQRSWKVN